MQDKERFILNNLQISNRELALMTGLSKDQIKRLFAKQGITRTKEQMEQIMLRKGGLQTGSNNPNWKGGVSKEAYRYKKNQVLMHPERIAARDKVYKAIKKGALVRMPCEVCGQEPTEAHHKDYSRPLDIQWLCKVHHREADNKKKQTEFLTNEGSCFLSSYEKVGTY